MSTAEGITRYVDPTRDGDLLLFETSVHPRRPENRWRGGSEPEEPRTFVLLFTRQFSFEDEHQEYLGMNALTFDIEFDPADALVALPLAQKWECGGPPWTEAEGRRRGEATAGAPNGSTSSRRTFELALRLPTKTSRCRLRHYQFITRIPGNRR
jgi:hypothetical protein